MPADFESAEMSAGDRQRRAFVGVRRVHVERHSGDLEPEPADDQRQAEEHRGSMSSMSPVSTSPIRRSAVVPVTPYIMPMP